MFLRLQDDNLQTKIEKKWRKEARGGRDPRGPTVLVPPLLPITVRVYPPQAFLPLVQALFLLVWVCSLVGVLLC